MQTENLKNELLNNTLVRRHFGSIKASKADMDYEEQFSRHAWVANVGGQASTLVYPRGSGQQVRGLLFRNNRPDLLIIDDLEDTETIENEDVRRKRKVWFFADVMKCISRLSKDYKIIYIDTLKHEDSLLEDLLASPDWHSIRLEICDDNYNSYAPEFVSTEEIKKEAQAHRESGMLDVFFREYRNIPISLEDAVFKQSYFKYYEETDVEFRRNLKNIETFLVIDPAKTAKLHSAESSIVAVGVDRTSSKIFIRDVVASKMLPDELYNELFLMAARFKARVVGVEVTSLHEFIVQPIKNEMFRRGIVFELIELHARGGQKKEMRVAQLAPYYRHGFIYHNKNCCDALESQLLSFPRSKRFDIMDAEAYLIEMLEVGGRYFEMPEFEDPEEEYRELENDGEEPISDWRIV
jgi:hypothetical protein